MVKVYAPLSRYQVLGVVYATSSEASRGSSLEVDMMMLSVERVVNDEDDCGGPALPNRAKSRLGHLR